MSIIAEVLSCCFIALVISLQVITHLGMSPEEHSGGPAETMLHSCRDVSNLVICGQGPPPPNPAVVERFQQVISQLFQQVPLAASSRPFG